MKYHFYIFWPLYGIALVLTLLFGSLFHRWNKPPNVFVIDGCQYLRVPGLYGFSHKGNCTNH